MQQTEAFIYSMTHNTEKLDHFEFIYTLLYILAIQDLMMAWGKPAQNSKVAEPKLLVLSKLL